MVMEREIEVEMTKKEYKEYLKMSEFEKEQKYDLSANTFYDNSFVCVTPNPILTEIV